MDSPLGDWESLVRAMNDIPLSLSLELGQDASPLMTSPLAPRPLRLRSSPITTTTTTTTSNYSIPSPPQSPVRPVLVSLHVPEPSQVASNQLTLHRYRKSLSRSRPVSYLTETPVRRVKRKPRALNLHYIQRAATPLSPPLTPPLHSSEPHLSVVQSQPQGLARLSDKSSRDNDHSSQQPAGLVSDTATGQPQISPISLPQAEPPASSFNPETRPDPHCRRLVSESNQPNNVFFPHVFFHMLTRRARTRSVPVCGDFRPDLFLITNLHPNPPCIRRIPQGLFGTEECRSKY